MALVLQLAWGRVSRPWGFEVRVDLVDDATGQVYNECLTFPGTPTAEQETAAITALIAQRTAALAPPAPAPEYRIVCEDDTEVLL